MDLPCARYHIDHVSALLHPVSALSWLDFCLARTDPRSAISGRSDAIGTARDRRGGSTFVVGRIVITLRSPADFWPGFFDGHGFGYRDASLEGV